MHAVLSTRIETDRLGLHQDNRSGSLRIASQCCDFTFARIHCSNYHRRSLPPPHYGIFNAAPTRVESARRIRTRLEWRDLVLAAETLTKVKEIKLWLQHKETFLHEWDMGRKFRPGYTALFYGPPGTGKTMTATLLGKATNRDVYRIDLSGVISKYIGETEKNLARIFDLAESKEWILFFDEADSLFGKRGRVSDARDRYANQDVSFLLQRLEEFNGLSILASNLKSNMDDAFMRRFQSVVYFPRPNPEMRRILWKQAFPPQIQLEEGIELKQLADKYELTGAAIMNVVRYVSLLAIDRGDHLVRKRDLLEGVRRGYLKEGRAM